MNKSARLILGMASIALTAFAPMAANAQDMSDKWRFNVNLYGWFPDIGGSTTFPAGTGSNIDIANSQILDSLKFTFMGTFEAHKGRWGMFTDVVYLDVGGSKSGSRDLVVDGHPLPIGVTANTQLDLKSTIWTLAGTYSVGSDARSPVYLLAGARYAQIRPSLGWEFSADLGGGTVPGRTGNSEVKEDVTDGIVGAKGQLGLGGDGKWYVPWYVDIGTGQSDLTWQAVGGIGYKFSWGQAFAVWRYLDYNFKSGSKIEDVDFNGPAIGVGFSW